MTWPVVFDAMNVLGIEEMRVYSTVVAAALDLEHEVKVYRIESFKFNRWSREEVDWPAMESLLMENDALSGKVIVLNARNRTIQIAGEVRVEPQSFMWPDARRVYYDWSEERD